MEFLDGKHARAEIRKGLASSTRADLVVAYWGSGAIEELGLVSRAGDVRIICNLETGGTNPDVIRKMLSLAKDPGQPLSVRQNDRLHAKVYLFDDFAVVGSSNASTNGLAFEGSELTSWSEANILVRDLHTLEQLRDWASKLGHRKIGDGDITRAEKAWKARRAVIRLPRDTSSTVLQALRFEPATLERLPVSVAIYDEELTPGAATREKELREEWATDRVGLFEDWATLPRRRHLMSFFEEGPGQFRFDGVWERRGAAEDRKMNGTILLVAWKLDDVFGKKPVGVGEASAWSLICERIMAARRRGGRKAHTACIPLKDVVTRGYLPEHLKPDTVETDVWRSIHALEARLADERGRTVRLTRTRNKIGRVQEQKTVRDLVIAKKPSDGFRMLIDREMARRTFEAVALRHPEDFDERTLAVAKARLDGEGIRPEEYLAPGTASS